MAFQISIAAVAGRGRLTGFNGPMELFAGRLAPYAQVDFPLYASEALLLESLGKQKSRVPAMLVLLDSRGRSLSSEAFAAWLQKEKDQGRQSIVLAIGPASGWSEEARAQANLLLSLGPMTLPHELARVVLTEQVYRAFTIMAGHPYHTGH